MKLWFETHSTSVDNERGVASGHSDAPLSELGRLQAADLGRRYADRRLRSIYTSDLRRAVSTAEIAFANSKLPRVPDRRLRECDYGGLSGCAVEELHQAKVKFADRPFPGGESFRDVVVRVESFLNDLPRGEDGVLIIAHRAPWYALEHLLKGRDLLRVLTAPWTWQAGWEYEL